jgi:hypothetical protein
MRLTGLYQRPPVARSGQWQTDLLAWWPMAQPSGGAVVNTITGKASAMTGATWQPTALGYAVDFSGTNQNINLGRTSLAGSATLSVWMNADTFAYGSNDAFVAGVFSRGQWGADGNGDIRIVFQSFGGDNLRAQVRTSSADYEASLSASNLTVGRWHHLALVYDEGANRLYLYVDGVRRTTTTTAGTMADAAKDWVLGAYPNNVNNTEFNGKLADARIYGRALSTDEIMALYRPESRWALYQPTPYIWYAEPAAADAFTGTSAVTAAAATLSATGSFVQSQSRGKLLLLGIG